jgi:acetyl esterase/lipase
MIRLLVMGAFFCAPMTASATDAHDEVLRIFLSADTPSFTFNQNNEIVRIDNFVQPPAMEKANADPIVFRLDLSGGGGRLDAMVSSKGAYEVYHGKRKIFTCDPGDIFCPFIPCRDGVSFLAGSDWKSTHVSLFRFSLAGKPELIHADPDNMNDLSGLVLTNGDEPALAAVYYIGDRIRYYFYSPILENLHGIAANLFPDADILWTEGDEAGESWLCQVITSDCPESWYRFSRDSVVPEKLFGEEGDPANVKVKPYTYRTRDGLLAPGYLALPSGSGAGPYPLIVFIHGGPSMRVYPWFDPRVQALTRYGYAVFQPNYRGSRGYGKKWHQDGWREWGIGAAQHDVTDGVTRLIEAGIADPNRIAAFGGSFGGYGALAALAFTPDLYQCGVAFFGPSDLLAFIQESDSSLAGMNRPMFGDSDNPDDRDRLVRQSPLYASAGIGKPLFLYHGAADALVPVGHSDAIAASMRERGAPIEYHRHPSAGHGFVDTRHEAEVFRQMLRFLDQYLMGRNCTSPPEAGKARLTSMPNVGEDVILNY